jgi:hypothetical protein
MPKTPNPRVINVDNREEIPNCEHWAIFDFDRVSRDDGYGGTRDETAIRYTAFLDKGDWLAEIAKREQTRYGYVPYAAFRMQAPAKVTVKVDADDTDNNRASQR